jgi:hypothetical protein
MTLDRLIERELSDYCAARATNDRAAAWRALERLHILSQREFWPHIQSHVQMLGYAIALGDPKEVAGQLLRLALAPLGNLTGRLPTGNTGRAHVSAFMPMEIPEELQRQIKDAGAAN